MRIDSAVVRARFDSLLAEVSALDEVFTVVPGDVFDPADLDLYLRKSYSGLRNAVLSQGEFRLNGTLTLEVFTRCGKPESGAALCDELAAAFDPETGNPDRHSFFTVSVRHLAPQLEGLWLRSGISVEFSAW